MINIIKKPNDNAITLDMSGGNPSTIKFNTDKFNTGDDFLNSIMKLSNIEESERDLFNSMLFDYDRIMGTIFWRENKKFIRYVSASGNPEENISNITIQNCIERMTDNCESKDCEVHHSLSSGYKCVPKKSIIEFKKGQYILASKRNTYEIIDSIEMAYRFTYIRIFKRVQPYNGKPIYLIMNPSGFNMYPEDKLIEHTTQITSFMEEMYTKNSE
jgi:hypothetical protein